MVLSAGVIFGRFVYISFRTLSGGQQQRTLPARALCAAENILMLDEPAAALDPEASAEMCRLTDGLHDGGMTVVMITHDAAAAVGAADRILHIGRSPGRTVSRRGG